MMSWWLILGILFVALAVIFAVLISGKRQDEAERDRIRDDFWSNGV